MIDFRGRLYVDSVISYQSAKIFRHLFVYKHTSGVNFNTSIVQNIKSYITRIKEETTFIIEFPKINLDCFEKEIF
jgi:hypothetical protein